MKRAMLNPSHITPTVSVTSTSIDHPVISVLPSHQHSQPMWGFQGRPSKVILSSRINRQISTTLWRNRTHGQILHSMRDARNQSRMRNSSWSKNSVPGTESSSQQPTTRGKRSNSLPNEKTGTRINLHYYGRLQTNISSILRGCKRDTDMSSFCGGALIHLISDPLS